MNKFLALISVLGLSGCMATNHSWVFFDNQTKECTMIYDRPLIIGDHIHWTDINGSSRRTSSDFDIAVVHNERYDLAADQIGVNVENCIFVP